jgi:hypothetical protein
VDERNDKSRRSLQRGNHPRRVVHECGLSVSWSVFPRHVCSDRLPALLSPRPHVSVATLATLSIIESEGCSGVDDREITHQSHADIMHGKLRNRRRCGGILQELLSIQQCAVGGGTQKIIGRISSKRFTSDADTDRT